MDRRNSRRLPAINVDASNDVIPIGLPLSERRKSRAFSIIDADNPLANLTKRRESRRESRADFDAAELPIGGLGAIGLGMNRRESRAMSMFVAEEHAAGQAQIYT